jgi:hypothetical protein
MEDMNAPERAVGYSTFPERKLAVSPESRQQARLIRATCEARGLILHKLVGDVESQRTADLERPGLRHALELLERREATCLVVQSLDRLTTSAASLGELIEWLDEHETRLVAIDLDLDTTTGHGRLAARALAEVGRLERSQTEERPPVAVDPPVLKERIARMRASGMTLQAIADTLNSEGIPTLRGGRHWRPSSVQAATGYRRPRRHGSLR